MREWRADLMRGERNVPIVPAASAGIRKHLDDIGRTRVVSYRLVGKAAGEGDRRCDRDTVNRLAPRSPEMQVTPAPSSAEAGRCDALNAHPVFAAEGRGDHEERESPAKVAIDPLCTSARRQIPSSELPHDSPCQASVETQF